LLPGDDHLSEDVSSAIIAYVSGQLVAEERLSFLQNLTGDDFERRALRSFILIRSGAIPEDLHQSRQKSLRELLLSALVSFRLGRFAEAAEFAKDTLPLEPDGAPRAICLLALTALKSAQPAMASQYLANYQGDPNFVRSLMRAIEALSLDIEETRDLELALTLAPSVEGFCQPLGKFLLKQGDSQAAYSCAAKLLELNPKNADAHILAARALGGIGYVAAAEKHWNAALDSNPSNPDALNGLGFLMQANGNFARAKDLFKRSLAANRVQGAPHWGLCVEDSTEKGNEENLTKLVRDALTLPMSHSQRAYAYYAIAKTLADQSEYGKAMLYYDDANGQAALGQWGSRDFDRKGYERYFEATREIFTEEFIERHRKLASADNTPIFIIGMMRSGTTLMEQVLSSHPLVTAGGELSFWLDHGPRVVDPGERRIDPERVSGFVSGYLAGLRSISPEGRVTDKKPENAQMLGLINLLMPKAKVIHMNRHPVDVCLSIYMTPYERSAPFAHVKENIVFAYRQQQSLMQHWRSVLPGGAFLDVSYEELVDQSETVIRRVLEFCELPWDDACLRHDQNKRTVNTPSVWQVRQPIYKSSAERWRRYEPFLGAFADLLQDPLH
jgi:tetratricopeptide (TPR) repeat protein